MTDAKARCNGCIEGDVEKYEHIQDPSYIAGTAPSETGQLGIEHEQQRDEIDKGYISVARAIGQDELCQKENDRC